VKAGWRQAARISVSMRVSFPRKASPWPETASVLPVSCPAARCAAATPSPTALICTETASVTAAASATFRAIYRVAVPCCSTAAAMALATLLISATAAPAAAWMAPLSPLARPVWAARLFTTAKPLPALPARAASIVAFSASLPAA